MAAPKRSRLTHQRARELAGLVFRDIPGADLTRVWIENGGPEVGYRVAVTWREQTYRIFTATDWYRVRGGDPRK